MTNKILSKLVLMIVFFAGFSKADRMQPPAILTINSKLSMYAEAAEKFIESARKSGAQIIVEGGSITIDKIENDDLFSKVVKLRDNAVKSGWIFGECEDGSHGKDFGVQVDQENGLIKDIILCGS